MICGQNLNGERHGIDDRQQPVPSDKIPWQGHAARRARDRGRVADAAGGDAVHRRSELGALDFIVAVFR
jgi:hypothetical protein